ncbi:MAG TPA: T9SS type A sorting domain-containing protein [Chitinophagaceae bacterium]|nr:T9SS type A sorting domain-containing protein [Chitinophagaceae bacterium]
MKWIKHLLCLGTGITLITAMARGQGPDLNRVPFNPAIDNVNYWVHMAKRGLAPDFRTTGPHIPAVFKSSQINASPASFINSPDVAITTGNSQSENSVFVNPNNLAIAINSNNSLVSGIYRASAYNTSNTGATWSGVNSVEPNSYADPAVVIDNNNNWYVNYITQGYKQSVAKSINNGVSWTITQSADPGAGLLADKNHFMVDNSITSPYQGNLYNAWTMFYGGGVNNQKVHINRSTDGGATWSANLNISGALGSVLDQGVNIQTGPVGEVYVAWAVYAPSFGDESAIGFCKSTNGGATYTAPVTAINNIRGIRVTGCGKSMRANSFPSMAVDNSFGPNRGTIYIVWTNVGVPGVNTGTDVDVYMIKSSNGGSTWSTPVRVNGGPTGVGKKHYFGWITCDPKTGTLNVIFYDDRNVSSTQVEAWVATSCDGGVNWIDFRVSDVAFTPNVGAGGYFGDYLGISSYDNAVYPVWTDNRSGTALAYTSPFILTDSCNCANDLVIQNVVFPLNFTKHYKAANTITVAGSGTTVTLTGNGVTGSNIILQAGGIVTIGGGFTAQLGSSLKVRHGDCDTTITARPANQTLKGINDPEITSIVNKSADELERMSKMGKDYFLVYPNPANNRLTVYVPMDDKSVKKRLLITDLMGKVVKQQQIVNSRIDLDVSGLPRGGYMVIVTGPNNTQQTRKLILH